jgi:ligand-binding sensor domain-containing protein
MKIKLFPVFLLFILFSYSSTSFAGSDWLIYNTENSGLPDNTVWSIVSDNYNNLWFGTNDGLAYFDGEWKTYESPTQSQVVQVVAVDRNKDMSVWIGTANGLAKLTSEEKWVKFNSFSPVYNKNIKALVFDKDGTLWIGTADGLVSYDGDNNWDTYTKHYYTKLPSDNINALAVDIDNNLWIGTEAGLAKFDGSQWEVFTKENSPLPDNTIWSLHADRYGTIYIGTYEGGLAIKNGDDWKIHTKYSCALMNNQINVVLKDERTNVWVGNIGLFKLDQNDDWITYHTANTELPSNRVISIEESMYGDIWIGTYGKGAALFRHPFTGVEDENVKSLEKSVAYPNPTSETTTIEYQIDKAEYVTIIVSDMFGNRIATLVNKWLDPRQYREVFEVSELSQGTYFYTIIAGNSRKTGNFIVIK